GHFEEALRAARRAADTPQERGCVQAIEAGYRQYRQELDRLLQEGTPGRAPTALGPLADSHPARPVVAPGPEVVRPDQPTIRARAQARARALGRVGRVMVLVGVAGPLGGLVSGLGIARGLSRSILQLSVRVQDVAQRLEQDVASVRIVTDGDLRSLDRQLQHV